MATLQNLLDNLKNTRETSQAKHTPEYIQGMDKLIAALSQANSNLGKLSEAVKDQIAANKATEKVGKASDVQKTIRAMLEAKIASDKIDQDRYTRYMNMAESLVPEITEERLNAFREQRQVFKEHRESLESSLKREDEIAEVRKKALADYTEFAKKQNQAIADKQIKVANAQLDVTKKQIATDKASAEFAMKDKFGTISGAIGGLEAKAQDPFSKFLVQGLGRFVTERKQAPIAELINKRYGQSEKIATARTENTKKEIQAQADARTAQTKKKMDAASADIDKISAERKAEIQERFDIKAAREHIIDPGAITDLFKTRDDRIAEIAKQAAGYEVSLLKGGSRKGKDSVGISAPSESTGVNQAPKNAKFKRSKATTQTSIGISAPSGSPVVKPVSKNAKFKRSKATTQTSIGISAPSGSPVVKPVSKNAKFKRSMAATQTSPVTPGAKVTGALGSKAGFINLGGITKGLGSLAGNFTKFLGPWGFVANAIMSLDKLVPIISDGAGALMDMSKLLMPMVVSRTIELGNILLKGLNSLIETLDNSWIGSKWAKENKDQISAKQKDYTAQEIATIDTRLKAKQQLEKGVGLSEMSDPTTGFGKVSVSRKSAPTLTDPIEANTTMAGGPNPEDSTSAALESLVNGMQNLPNTLADIQRSSLKAILDAPTGTTLITSSSPFLTGWTI